MECVRHTSTGTSIQKKKETTGAEGASDGTRASAPSRWSTPLQDVWNKSSEPPRSAPAASCTPGPPPSPQKPSPEKQPVTPQNTSRPGRRCDFPNLGDSSPILREAKWLGAPSRNNSIHIGSRGDCEDGSSGSCSRSEDRCSGLAREGGGDDGAVTGEVVVKIVECDRDINESDYDHWLFQKDGVRYNDVMRYSITPEPIADRMARDCADIFPGGVVYDGFGGAGGNMVAFAAHGMNVVASDIEREHVEYANANADVYGVSSKCSVFCADYNRMVERLEGLGLGGGGSFDLVFLDLPWGGKAYRDKCVYMIERMADGKMSAFDVTARASQLSHSIIFKCPKNIALDDPARLALWLEQQRLDHAVKTHTPVARRHGSDPEADEASPSSSSTHLLSPIAPPAPVAPTSWQTPVVELYVCESPVAHGKSEREARTAPRSGDGRRHDFRSSPRNHHATSADKVLFAAIFLGDIAREKLTRMGDKVARARVRDCTQDRGLPVTLEECVEKLRAKRVTVGRAKVKVHRDSVPRGQSFIQLPELSLSRERASGSRGGDATSNDSKSEAPE